MKLVNDINNPMLLCYLNDLNSFHGKFIYNS